MSSIPRTTSKSSQSNNDWKQDQIGKDASFKYRPVDPSIIKKMPSEKITFVDIKLLELISIRLLRTIERIKNAPKHK